MAENVPHYLNTDLQLLGRPVPAAEPRVPDFPDGRAGVARVQVRRPALALLLLSDQTVAEEQRRLRGSLIRFYEI